MRRKLILLESLNQTLVSNIGGRIKVRHDATGHNLVEIRKLWILPVFSHALPIGILNSGIVEPTLQILLLVFCQERTETCRYDGFNMRSDSHSCGILI